MVNTLIQPGDNPDITLERKKATFDIHQMGAFIHGGEHNLQRRKEILEFVESRPEFKDPIPPEFMTREDRVMNNGRKAVAMTDLADAIDGSDFFGEGIYYQGLIMGRDLHGMSLHYAMFFPTIQNQSDDEQLDNWLPLVVSRAIIGTYAQTELGHGTNLQKLETRATYDSKTKEFILHSPQITAAKWWPGGLGKTANHAIVMAQLYTQGKCFGPHPFFVQLRDLDTHMPMKGVKLGDIGPKLGINGSDNGFLLFDQYRIPRKNMFMRYAKVNEDGTYIAPKHSKLGFGAMVFVRSIMIKDQAMQLAAAATIAVRYSAVRRQGEPVTGAGEVQIIDYLTQRHRLLPQVARAYAFHFAACQTRDMYLKLTEDLNTGSTELLPEIHIISSGLKSIVSWETAQGIEQCRLGCGGHGYSQASAFPEIYAYAVGGCTYEGENLVMLLQVARALNKAAEGVISGSAKLADLCEYLGRKGNGKSSFTVISSATPQNIIHDFEHVARTQVFRAHELLKKNQSKMSNEEAWNRTSVEWAKAARMHVKLYLIKNFFNKVAEAVDSSIRHPLHELAMLYALDLIAAAGHEFLRNGFMIDSQLDSVRDGIYVLLEKLRPNCVALVDAFDLSDRELHSVLGRRDGNVYEHLIKWAQQSQLNQKEVLPTFDKYFKPMMLNARANL
ncbi:unnamed protein product, partial [Mesorhabditis belari]|uniref:Acyl-coenzyme A oxidase n=1 Tax=Mesorhabditis belari TaxID=2138241 RepID=A0AAF3FPX7_9BILA